MSFTSMLIQRTNPLVQMNLPTTNLLALAALMDPPYKAFFTWTVIRHQILDQSARLIKKRKNPKGQSRAGKNGRRYKAAKRAKIAYNEAPKNEQRRIRREDPKTGDLLYYWGGAYVLGWFLEPGEQPQPRNNRHRRRGKKHGGQDGGGGDGKIAA